MGQLEKYGLYVLCLVIFLILGVTIWGGGEVTPVRVPTAPIRADVNAAVQEAPRDLARVAADILLQPSPEPQRGSARPEDASVSRADAAPIEQATPPAPAPTVVSATYKVQEGDTFARIAKTKLGKESLWTEIQRLNPEIKASALRPGQELKLPTPAAAGAEPKKALDAPLPMPADGTRVYVVRKNDNFERIAQEQLGSRKRVAELMAANPGVAPEKLRPGMSIKLPKK